MYARVLSACPLLEGLSSFGVSFIRLHCKTHLTSEGQIMDKMACPMEVPLQSFVYRADLEFATVTGDKAEYLSPSTQPPQAYMSEVADK